MTTRGDRWVAALGAVGFVAGTGAAIVLWLLVMHPIGVLQALAGWP